MIYSSTLRSYTSFSFFIHHTKLICSCNSLTYKLLYISNSLQDPEVVPTVVGEQRRDAVLLGTARQAAGHPPQQARPRLLALPLQQGHEGHPLQ